MECYVASALKSVGEVFPFAVTELLNAQEYGGGTVEFAEPLTVEGTYTFDGEAFLLNAKANTVLSSACARCGEPFLEPLRFEISERFVRNTDFDDAEDCYCYSGDRLVITDAVMDNLYLHLPLVSVCKPDCKGLCPICGINQNFAVCDCASSAKQNPFSALEALCIDNKEV